MMKAIVTRPALGWLVVCLGLAAPGCENLGLTGLKPGGKGDDKVSLELREGEWIARAKATKGTAEGELATVRRYFKSGDYRRAVGAAKKLLKRHPGDEANEEALCLAGEAELARGRHYQAYEFFERQVTDFPAGEFFQRGLRGEVKAANALLAGKKRRVLGIFRMKAEEEGVMMLTKIAEQAPGTALAETSLLRIADHYYDKQKHQQAVEAYDQLLRLFPRSRYAAHAMLRAADSTYAMYKGGGFDETPLLDARERYELFGEHFPDRASQAGVRKVLAEIEEARAAKVYGSAEFYERTRRPRTAAFYYNKVVELFPETRWADQAHSSLGRLGAGRPRRRATSRRHPAAREPRETGRADRTDKTDRPDKVQQDVRSQRSPRDRDGIGVVGVPE